MLAVPLRVPEARDALLARDTDGAADPPERRRRQVAAGALALPYVLLTWDALVREEGLTREEAFEVLGAGLDALAVDRVLATALGET